MRTISIALLKCFVEIIIQSFVSVSTFHVSKRPIARSFMCQRSVDYMKIPAKSWVQYGPISTVQYSTVRTMYDVWYYRSDLNFSFLSVIQNFASVNTVFYYDNLHCCPFCSGLRNALTYYFLLKQIENSFSQIPVR